MSDSITMKEALMMDIRDLKKENENQARLLAMSADREEKLRTDLMLARKLADSAMLESDRLRAKLKQARDCFSAAMELAERYKAEIDAMQ